jgi:hypothetical protein
LERGAAGRASLETLAACAAAVGTQLAAFIEATPGSDLPRDIEHLRRQQLVIVSAVAGGWSAVAERSIDPLERRSRSIDVCLERAVRGEIAVVEIVDLLADGGEAMRGLADKVAAIRREHPAAKAAGLLILRATRRNRRLVGDLRAVFISRFRGSSVAWLKALADPERPMPMEDGLAWSSVRGDRLFAFRP